MKLKTSLSFICMQDNKGLNLSECLTIRKDYYHGWSPIFLNKLLYILIKRKHVGIVLLIIIMSHPLFCQKHQACVKFILLYL